MAEKNDEVKSYCEKPLDSYREHDLPGKLYDAMIGDSSHSYLRHSRNPISNVHHCNFQKMLA